MAESEEELKSLLMRVKEESEKAVFKLNIKKKKKKQKKTPKIMESSSITSWKIEVKAVTGFISLDSKITVDGDCSHEIKRPSYLEEKLGQT